VIKRAGEIELHKRGFMNDRTFFRILAGLGLIGGFAGAYAYRSYRVRCAAAGHTKMADLRKIEPDRSTEEVDAASEDSFPASDAPPWTGTGV